MEEKTADIDILEEKIKNVKKYDTYTYTWNEQDIQVISNLITENKELKEKNKELEKMLKKGIKYTNV